MKRNLFTEEHEMFRDAFRRFVKKEIVPHNDQWEKDGIVSRDLWTRAGQQGFLGMDVPEAYGGSGVEDFRYNAIMSEEIIRVGAMSVGVGLSLHNDIVLPYFLNYCNEKQKRRWLPGICAGELILAIAMTEPNAGSDLAAVRTTGSGTGTTIS